MAEQEYSKDQIPDQDSDTSLNEDETSQNQANSELTSELDGLLDEIDSVLETNAEEFVKSYVQKGGQ
ncbi:ubiquitin-like protein Pup [bacterium]|nr:ubiquitin-like protein Pup [bacterium]|tara:strand:+ start:125 stop:325 length:201 start_codon:yes stop_codon:yes gene_type:complete